VAEKNAREVKRRRARAGAVSAKPGAKQETGARNHSAGGAPIDFFKKRKRSLPSNLKIIARAAVQTNL
jgi:hypothetical protein